jgi:hypothetical protein
LHYRLVSPSMSRTFPFGLNLSGLWFYGKLIFPA